MVSRGLSSEGYDKWEDMQRGKKLTGVRGVDPSGGEGCVILRDGGRRDQDCVLELLMVVWRRQEESETRTLGLFLYKREERRLLVFEP